MSKKEHTLSDCIRDTDDGREIDCNCKSDCSVCFPKSIDNFKIVRFLMKDRLLTYKIYDSGRGELIETQKAPKELVNKCPLCRGKGYIDRS